MGSCAAVSPGDRVADREGARGTVRYVGPVVSSKTADALYAGIEWDAAGRGKGDGAARAPSGDEVRYFTTAPGMASFLKLELVVPGHDMLQALAERYEPPPADAAAEAPAAAAAAPGAAAAPLSPTPRTGGGGGGITVHLAGEDKVKAAQRLARLTSASLQGAALARVEPAALAAACPRLREVDVSGTLLARWADLAALGTALPALATLHAGGNRFEFLGDTTAEALPRDCLAGLRVLVLNGTPLTWGEVARLVGRCAPALEELHLVGCGLTGTVEQPASWAPDRGGGDGGGAPARGRVMQARCGDSFVPGSLFPRLRVLNLSGNARLGAHSGWGALHALRALPSLQWLLAGGCGLTSIFADVRGGDQPQPQQQQQQQPDAPAAPVDPPPWFPALTTLSLAGGTALSSPASIDALDGAFPALTTLRLGPADFAFSSPAAELAASGCEPLLPAAAGGHAELQATVTASAPPTAASSSSPPVGEQQPAAAPAVVVVAAPSSSCTDASLPQWSPAEARQLLIARLPRLTSLNGSEVSVKERRDGERAYTRRVGAAFARAWVPPAALPCCCCSTAAPLAPPASPPSSPESSSAVAATASTTPPPAAGTVAWSGGGSVVDLFGAVSATLPACAWDATRAAAARWALRNGAGGGSGHAGVGGAPPPPGAAAAGDGAAAPLAAGGPPHVRQPTAFRRAGDGGLIRSMPTPPPRVPFALSPVPAFALSAPRGGSATLPPAVASGAAAAARPPPHTAAAAAAAEPHVCGPCHQHQPPYVPAMDPCALGAAQPAAAGALQRAFPRYFIVAAAHDLHGDGAVGVGAGAGGASSVAATAVVVTLRSVAGRSCTRDPVTKRLPLSMTVGALKVLAARLFRAPDVRCVRLAWLEGSGGGGGGGSSSSYPVPLEHDLKPLSYYGVGAESPSLAGGGDSGEAGDAVGGSGAGSGASSGAAPAAGAASTPLAAAAAAVGEVLMEEVDAGELARAAAAAAAAAAALEEDQAARGDALLRAADRDRGARLPAPAP